MGAGGATGAGASSTTMAAGGGRLAPGALSGHNHQARGAAYINSTIPRDVTQRECSPSNHHRRLFFPTSDSVNSGIKSASTTCASSRPWTRVRRGLRARLSITGRSLHHPAYLPIPQAPLSGTPPPAIYSWFASAYRSPRSCPHAGTGGVPYPPRWRCEATSASHQVSPDHYPATGCDPPQWSGTGAGPAWAGTRP